MKECRMYGDLAWVWPIISPPEDYVGEAEQFRKAIERHTKTEVRALLDIGCGGGHNDLFLKKYFKVTGADISEGMLANAKKLNPECEYLIGDMRSLDLGRQFDAVIIADAICYMLTEADLKAAFETAYEHLRPGGVFCTYVELTTETFQQNEVAFCTHKKEGIEVTLIENNYDPDPTDRTYEYTAIYLIRRGGKTEVHFDRHIAGVFGLDTWRELLRKVGFEVEESKFEDDAEGAEYPLFICVKEQ